MKIKQIELLFFFSLTVTHFHLVNIYDNLQYLAFSATVFNDNKSLGSMTW